MWTKPSASVLAIDATPVRDASNTLIATARAKVSVRIAPGDTAENASAALREHLLSNAPWGARVEVEAGQGGAGTRIDLSGDRATAALAALREGFGVEAVQIGTGGSIPSWPSSPN
nr:peptidase dimerization domain-containing protein [Tessaracoccus coleopterorum]